MTGLELKKIREKLGLTQKELSEMIGKSMRTVITWEKSEELSLSQETIIKSVLHSEDTSHVNNTLKEIRQVYKPEGRVIIKEDLPKKEVYVIPIKGRGGLENKLFDEVLFKDLKTEALTIKQPASNGSKYFKIEVEGISMDDGSKRSLSEGDWAENYMKQLTGH